ESQMEPALERMAIGGASEQRVIDASSIFPKAKRLTNRRERNLPDRIVVWIAIRAGAVAKAIEDGETWIDLAHVDHRLPRPGGSGKCRVWSARRSTRKGSTDPVGYCKVRSQGSLD